MFSFVLFCFFGIWFSSHNLLTDGPIWLLCKMVNMPHCAQNCRLTNLLQVQLPHAIAFQPQNHWALQQTPCSSLILQEKIKRPKRNTPKLDSVAQCQFYLRGCNDPLVLKWMPRLKGMVDLKILILFYTHRMVFFLLKECKQKYFAECPSSSFPYNVNEQSLLTSERDKKDIT